MVQESNYQGVWALLNDSRLKLSDNPHRLLFDLACKSNNDALLIAKELLTKHKITANPEKDNYWSPLHVACAKGDHSMAALLLNHGANINVSCLGSTPLHEAAKNGDTDIVNLLIEQHADCNLKNNDGLTAFEEALNYGRMDIAEKLLPKTTIDAQSFYKHGTLNSLSYSPELKIMILEKGLQDYIKQRRNESEYGNIFRLGYSQQEKIDAAGALLLHITDPTIKLLPQQIEVLQNGRLGNLYSQYQKILGNGRELCQRYKKSIAATNEADTNPEPDNTSENDRAVKF